MTLAERAAQVSPAEIVALLQHNEALRQQTAALQRQVEWFQRHLFGRKSEKRVREPGPDQLSLAGMLTVPVLPADQPPPPTETVKAYQRRLRFAAGEASRDDSDLRFDPSVPVQEILLTNPEVAALPPEAYEVIGEKVTYRLAQRPGAYVILKYIRPVIKRKDTEVLACPPASPGGL